MSRGYAGKNRIMFVDSVACGTRTSPRSSVPFSNQSNELLQVHEFTLFAGAVAPLYRTRYDKLDFLRFDLICLLNRNIRSPAFRMSRDSLLVAKTRNSPMEE